MDNETQRALIAALANGLITVPIAIGGWWVAHHLSARRDWMNKRRDMTVQYLLDAYRRLENSSCRGQKQEEYDEQFQTALADIQLLGSAAQVNLAKEIAGLVGSGTGESVSITPLLEALRKDLRVVLGLTDVGQGIKIVRSPEELGRKHKKDNEQTAIPMQL